MSVQRLEEASQNVDKLPEECAPDGEPHDQAPELSHTVSGVSEADNSIKEETLGATQPANGMAEIVSKSQSGSTKMKLSLFRQLSSSRSQKAQLQATSADSNRKLTRSQSSGTGGTREPRSGACNLL